MANWAQKLKLHHLQTLIALGDSRRPNDEYHPASVVKMVITARR